MIEVPFKAFSKIPRFSRDIIVTEKVDGTNAQIFIGENGEFLTGSRTRWITPEDDNYGFSKWAHAHKAELMELGPGAHFGEWWGQGIQRNYGLREKRFSLFNVHKWGEVRPACCGVVPVLYRGPFSESRILDTLSTLLVEGSKVVPGYMNPEGIVIFHTASGQLFKKTIDGDEAPKSMAA
jgi:hypothetical protein